MATNNSCNYIPVQYEVQIGGTHGSLVSVTNGTSGQVLTANTGAAPTWQTGGGGGITTIDGDTGFITGSTVTLAGSSGGTDYTGSSVRFISLIGNLIMILQTTDNEGNTLLGQSAGNASLSGESNTGFGANNLGDLTSGSNNTALGTLASGSVQDGSGNTAIGFEALVSLVSGSENTIIGDLAGTAYGGSESSNILIGSNVLGNTGNSNELYIGAGTGTGTGQINSTFISGIQGITVTGSAVLVSSSDQLGVVVSSRRYKENILDMGEISSTIHKLRPVSFNYIVGSDNSLQTGLVAEEVEEVMPSLCTYDKDGLIQSVKYHDLPALLLNELQKLRKEFDELKARLKD
jgi:hypothetical protein